MPCRGHPTPAPPNGLQMCLYVGGTPDKLQRRSWPRLPECSYFPEVWITGNSRRKKLIRLRVGGAQGVPGVPPARTGLTAGGGGVAGPGVVIHKGASHGTRDGASNGSLPDPPVGLPPPLDGHLSAGWGRFPASLLQVEREKSGREFRVRSSESEGLFPRAPSPHLRGCSARHTPRSLVSHVRAEKPPRSGPGSFHARPFLTSGRCTAAAAARPR